GSKETKLTADLSKTLGGAKKMKQKRGAPPLAGLRGGKKPRLHHPASPRAPAVEVQTHGGRHDRIVPPLASRRYARARPAAEHADPRRRQSQGNLRRLGDL